MKKKLVFTILLVGLILIAISKARTSKGQLVVLECYSEENCFLYKSPKQFWECKQEMEKHGKAETVCLRALSLRTPNGTKAKVLKDLSSEEGLLRVELMDGPHAGDIGWVEYTFTYPVSPNQLMAGD